MFYTLYQLMMESDKVKDILDKYKIIVRYSEKQDKLDTSIPGEYKSIKKTYTADVLDVYNNKYLDIYTIIAYPNDLQILKDCFCEIALIVVPKSYEYRLIYLAMEQLMNEKGEQ